MTHEEELAMRDGLVDDQAGVYGAEDEQEIFRRQLAQAQALKSGAFNQQHTSAVGAGLGGIAGIINTFKGEGQERQAYGGLANVLQQQRGVVSRYGHANNRLPRDVAGGRDAGASMAPMDSGMPAPEPMGAAPFVAPAAPQSDPRTLIPLLLRRQQQEQDAAYQMPNPLEFGG